MFINSLWCTSLYRAVNAPGAKVPRPSSSTWPMMMYLWPNRRDKIKASGLCCFIIFQTKMMPTFHGNKIQEVRTSAKEGTPLALWYQLHSHGFSSLRDGQASWFVGLNEGDVNVEWALGSRGQRGNLSSNHWKTKECSIKKKCTVPSTLNLDMWT